MPNFGQIKDKSWIIFLLSIFLFSFILDIYLLTRYNLSYGRDGPFYDLQVLNIIQTGFPSSNDPPLVYYMLTPFVLITGSSFLGIKIGMALFGSLMVFPAFFLTEIFNKNNKSNSRVPALLSAFLITINASYFAMIGDFMQNLVGVLFLLMLMYFLVKWLQNTRNWKKYGTITIILLACNILTHIYTGMLAIVIFISIILFTTAFKAIKTRGLSLFDLKIVGLMGLLVVGGLTTIFTFYPVMFSKFTTVISFFNGTSSSVVNSLPSNTTSIMVFLTIPFILGILMTIKILYDGLNISTTILKNQFLSKRTILAAIYLIMALVIIALALVPSDYQSRFILLAFVPIALIVPLGLKLVENLLNRKYPSKLGFKLILISFIAVMFAFSSFYTASAEFSSMGPSISPEQYNALLKIKSDYLGSEIPSNSVIAVNEYHMGYWVKYVLGLDVVSGNINDIQANYSNSTLYQIQITENQIQNSQQSSQSGQSSQYLWNPFLPYSFPVGFDLSSFNSLNVMNNRMGSSHPPNDISGNNSNETQFNKSNGPPGFNNSSNPTQMLVMGNGTFNNSNSPPSFGNSSGAPGDITAFNGMSKGSESQGTLIFSLNNVKIYKIS